MKRIPIYAGPRTPCYRQVDGYPLLGWVVCPDGTPEPGPGPSGSLELFVTAPVVSVLDGPRGSYGYPRGMAQGDSETPLWREADHDGPSSLRASDAMAAAKAELYWMRWESVFQWEHAELYWLRWESVFQWENFEEGGGA
jgi:hypothetical protein